MHEFMPPWPQLSAFIVASFVLAVTPGPGVLYVVTRTLVQGRAHGLISVAGVALGNLGNALAAAVGLAALFAISSLAFTVVKYAGAAYLVYLGVQMWRASPQRELPSLGTSSLARVFRDGFVVALLNPKTALFFAAFLPQFISPALPSMTQTIVLGAFFVMMAAVTDSLYVLAASAVMPKLQRVSHGRLGQRIGGGLFIALGLFTAVAGSRSAK